MSATDVGAATVGQAAPARAAAYVARHTLLALLAVLGLVAVGLAVRDGPRDLAQATVNGVVAGNYYALGAVGLTLIFGVLRLVNFAHGEFLTLGAYLMLLFASFDLPLLVAAALGVAA